MSKVRVDQLSPTDDSRTINVSDIAIQQDITDVVDDMTGEIPFKYDHNPTEDINAINNRASNRIKVSGFNIWGAQAVAKWGMANLCQRNKAIRETAYKMQVDLLGTSETLQNAGFPISLLSSYPWLNSAFSPSSPISVRAAPSDYNIGEGLICNGTMLSSSWVRYTDSSGTYSYLRAVVKVRDIQVAVYTTHLHFNDQSLRAQQIAQLTAAAVADSEPKVIIMGDMNTPSYHEFDSILSQGFSAVNLDDINTRNDGVPTNVWYYDQILYRGFSTLVSKGAIDVDPTKLSDHKPIYAELEV